MKYRIIKHRGGIYQAQEKGWKTLFFWVDCFMYGRYVSLEDAEYVIGRAKASNNGPGYITVYEE